MVLAGLSKWQNLFEIHHITKQSVPNAPLLGLIVLLFYRYFASVSSIQCFDTVTYVTGSALPYLALPPSAEASGGPNARARINPLGY